MGAAVELRQDFGADDLRQAARCAKTGAQASRLLALAAVLGGANRAEAARIGGMDRQTLRDWAHRFNQHGPDGLIDIKPPGRRPRLSDEQKQVLKQLVEDGPDPETDGVVRWRCVDLKRVVRDRFGVDLSEVSLGRVLKQLGFSRISARPRHPKQDPEAIEAFKKRLSSDGRRGRERASARDAHRGVVPRRNADRSEEQPRLSVGQKGIAATPAQGSTL